MFESHGHRINIEHYISDEVSSLIAPVCDNWFVTKFQSDNLLKPMLIALTLISKLLNPLEAALS